LNAGGLYPNEVIISIIDPLGQVIYTKPADTGTQGTSLFTGNVQCTSPVCGIPYNLEHDTYYNNTAILSWTEPSTALAWQVLVQPTGTAAPDSTTSGTMANEDSFHAGGLIPGNTYDFYVSSICTPTTNGAWSAPLTFTFPCREVLSINIIGAGTSTAVISWSDYGMATGWEILVLPTSDPPPTLSSFGTFTTSNPYTVTGLDPAIDYVVYIRSICSPTVSSDWAARSFSTLAVADYSTQGFTIFPNPATGQFIITTSNSNEVFDTLEIYSLLGRMVKKIQQPGKNATIDVTDLQKGVYIIKVTANSKTLIQKLIVQ
jgi:hypothetical protein